MTTGFFGDIAKVRYEGPDSTNPLAFRHYNPDEIVAGKRMEDHLRFAVAYWHTFVWPGGDPFGGQTFERPWFEDSMQAAKLKADVRYVSWIKPHGKGRVFYCGPSHQPESYETAALLRYYLDGIQYAIGDLKCDDAPRKE